MVQKDLINEDKNSYFKQIDWCTNLGSQIKDKGLKEMMGTNILGSNKHGVSTNNCTTTYKYQENSEYRKIGERLFISRVFKSKSHKLEGYF